jgi:hypothetical protein
MASINEVYNLVKYRANKNGYSSYISPADFNLLFPRAEIRYFNNLYAQYAQTQRISDSLSKFISDPAAIVVDSNGKYTFPADLFHVDSVTHTISGIQYPVLKVEKDRVASHLSSSIEAPSAEFPIYTQYTTFLQFYPISLATATLIYLKKPTTSVWAYTLNAILTYNNLTAGSSYTNGTYTNVPLTGGTGTGARATVVVSGSVVTSVTITAGGINYVVGDVLSALAANIGGTGSGFSIRVNTLSSTRPVYDSANSVNPQWSDTDIDSIINLMLMDLGINMSDQPLEQFALTQSKLAS